MLLIGRLNDLQFNTLITPTIVGFIGSLLLWYNDYTKKLKKEELSEIDRKIACKAEEKMVLDLRDDLKLKADIKDITYIHNVLERIVIREEANDKSHEEMHKMIIEIWQSIINK